MIDREPLWNVRRRPKVMHVGKFYPPHQGGMESHLQTLCAELQESVDLRVVVANKHHDRIDEFIDDVSVLRLETLLTLASTPFCLELTQQLRDSDADIIHIHWPNPAAVLAYLASGSSQTLVVTYHSDVVRQKVLSRLFEPLLHRFLRQAALIIVTSPNYLRSSSILALHRERCRVIPLGIPMQHFAKCDQETVKGLRQRFGKRLVLAVGRHVYYKGFDYLLDAMQNVDGRLLLVGDGPLTIKLQQRSIFNQISDRVAFLGPVPDVKPYYHAADVFVLPSVSRTEAFGIVQLEAMAACKPVINTALDSGVPFVSQHGVTGLTVPVGDPKALANSITLLLDNVELRSSLGKGAYARASLLFSARAMAAKTLQLYGELLGLQLESRREPTNDVGSRFVDRRRGA